MGLETEGLVSEGTDNRNKKNVSKQAIALHMLIKIDFHLPVIKL